MKTENWFTCAEFNAKTDANYHKHQAELAAALNIGNRAIQKEERRRKWLLALDFGLVAAMGTALGCLLSVLG